MDLVQMAHQVLSGFKLASDSESGREVLRFARLGPEAVRRREGELKAEIDAGRGGALGRLAGAFTSLLTAIEEPDAFAPASDLAERRDDAMGELIAKQDRYKAFCNLRDEVDRLARQDLGGPEWAAAHAELERQRAAKAWED